MKNSVLLALLILPSAQSAATYNLAAGWSNAANPNGVWSYNEGSNPLPFVSSWLPSFLGPGQQAWAASATGLGHIPVWFLSSITPPGGFDWQIGDVVVHSTDPASGGSAGPSNVTWTSPGDGQIDIGGSVWLGVDRGRGNQWTILVNGIALTGGTLLSGDAYSRASPFFFSLGSGGSGALGNILVSAGDVVMLRLDRNTAFGEFTGVDLTVTFTSMAEPIPEPASYPLVGFVLLGIGLWLRSKRA